MSSQQGQNFRIRDKSAQALRLIRSYTAGQLKEYAEEAHAQALEDCPVATGNLRDNTVLEEHAELDFRIATHTGYGLYVHEGTGRMAARPYILNAGKKAFERMSAIVKKNSS